MRPPAIALGYMRGATPIRSLLPDYLAHQFPCMADTVMWSDASSPTVSAWCAHPLFVTAAHTGQFRFYILKSYEVRAGRAYAVHTLGSKATTTGIVL